MGRIVIAWVVDGPAWVSPKQSAPGAPSWYSAGPYTSALAAVRAARAAGLNPTHHMTLDGSKRGPLIYLGLEAQETTV
jgi:hypothetical protein